MSVAGFLRAHVDSQEKLRVLLLIHGSRSGRVSAHTAAQVTGIPVDRVRGVAHELAEHQLVKILAGDELELRALPISERLSLAELAEWYQLDRGLVHDVVSPPPGQRHDG
jgi:hypothetical protein